MVYWHSDIFKDKYYHYNKSKMCSNLGVRLYHIWKDEWNNKQDIVKSNILRILNINSINISENYTIKECVNREDIEKFFFENYLYDISNYDYNIGLYYENELVSILILNDNIITYCDKNYTNFSNSFEILYNFLLNNKNFNEYFAYICNDSFISSIYEPNFLIDSILEPKLRSINEKSDIKIYDSGSIKLILNNK